MPSWLFTSHESVRIGMTVLTISSGFNLPVSVNLDPIMTPSKSIPSSMESWEIDLVCRFLGIKEEYVEWFMFHHSTKKGPNGQALMSSTHDFTLMPSWLKNKLMSLAGVGLKQCFDLIDSVSMNGISVNSWWNRIYPVRSSTISKLTGMSDKEGKTSVMGVVDYWSQTALKPLHDTLMRILSGIGPDCTHDQQSFLTKVPSSGVTFYSYDLTNATDSMPLWLQGEIISRMIGKDRAEDWKDILVKEEFSLKGHPAKIKFSAGQPMGAYSSWPSMALTHHAIVQLAWISLGNKSPTRDYVLLGDDMVIWNDKLAMSYRTLLSSLDMPISDQKTHISGSTFEFCKSWFVNGVEVTGFSVPGLWEVSSSYSKLANFLENQESHGWKPSDASAIPLIMSLYNCLGLHSQGKSVYKLYTVFQTLVKTKVTGEYSTMAKAMTEAFRWPFYETSNEIFASILGKMKEEQVWKDMESLQTNVYLFHDEFNKRMSTVNPLWASESYKTAYTERVPMLIMAEYLTMELEEKLMILTGDNSSDEYQELIFNESLGSYKLSKHFFGLKDEASSVRDLSRLVKPLINKVSEIINKSDPTTSVILTTTEQMFVKDTATFGP
ncbi:RNA-dependent RNA polymerase [Shahe narna-like virus 7]|uniref:RNA-dependent RNA polymerase n=1 Tax=Shahe narna-like virus 7 TaxID=1923435 RepID=UPI000909AFB8|nr:RNA-dependent RNA polymerase [Shahe narna-like virus 7]APG77176.1 RNA-dependent RNA polymerase [Shahe narna-like virus 7]